VKIQISNFNSMSKPTRQARDPKDLPREGRHLGVCKIVADLGTQESSNPDWAPRKVLMFIFELPSLSKKDKAVWVKKDVTFTPKSKGLKALSKSWLGINDTDFDYAECLGMAAEIKIVHSEDGQYANVEYVEATKKKPAKGFMKEVSCFLDKTFDLRDFKLLPEWLQSKAMDSEEYQSIAPKGRRGQAVEDEDEAPTRRRRRR